MNRAPRTSKLADFFDSYTKDLEAEDLQRLFTHDARDAYRFFTRGADADALKRLPWHKRVIAEARVLFLAFSMKLSPARRVVFGGSLLLALVGLFNLFRGFGIIQIASLPFGIGVGVPGPLFRQGTWSLLFAFALMNLLVLLEVADRLSLKNDLEIARDIQQAMLPSGLYSAPGVETLGTSRPANTVGGDFYDILPLEDGRLVVAVGDVAGKGSPAALLLRNDGRCERLADGGISLGMFEHSTYTTGHAVIQPNELIAVYSDGITEAENPSGTPFDEIGLETALKANCRGSLSAIGAAVERAVERHTDATRFTDDLTILLLRRCPAPMPMSV